MTVVDLTPGTIVYLKQEGLLKKLDPKYAGPYKIIKKTEQQNYEIIDASNAQVRFTVPLHKLKITSIDEELFDNSVEIDKIIDHKLENNKTIYKVIWKDKTTSWVDEDKFNTLEIVNEYKNNLKTNQQKRKPGRPRKKVNNLYFIKMLYYFALFLMIFCVTDVKANLVPIKDDFRFCNLNELTFWDEKNECSTSNIRTSRSETSWFTIYSKMHDVVEGEGYQCQKKKITYTTDESFFADKNLATDEINIVLSKKECEAMVSRRVCGESSQMTCEGESCWYTPRFTPSFKWLTKETTVMYSCHFTKRVIVAEHQDSIIFYSKCKPTDLFCILHDSTVIWTDKIIHTTCPYNEIATMQLTSGGSGEIIFFNKTFNLLFQIESKVKACGREMILTKEGV